VLFRSYFLRLADNTTQTAGQFITHGPVSIVADKTTLGTEYRYQSSGGANLVQMSEHLEDAAKALGSACSIEVLDLLELVRLAQED
jgi:hypothetical protein